MVKTVLVTGGLGYIGSVLVPRLRAEGLTVCVRDYGLFADCTIADRPGDDFVMSDCRGFDPHWLDGIDAVVHLAAFSNDPTDKLRPEQLYPPSLLYSERIAAACKERGIRFVFASSCSVYGIALDGIVDETSQVRPQTGYARNKVEIEEKLARIGDRHFKPIALRFGTVYGFSPRIRFDIVINMLTGMALVDQEIVLNSDGRSWRPHLNIEDAARAIQAALHADDAQLDNGLNIFNVGHAHDNRAIIDVARLIAEKAGDCPVKFLGATTATEKDSLAFDQNVRGGVDVRSYRVRFDKITERLGFSPRWRLETGIEDLIQSLRAVGLSAPLFRSPRFYRLRWTDHLVSEGRLTDQLQWSDADT